VNDPWLVDQTYGMTDPLDGYLLIQRNDEADLCDSDIAAALLYAEANGGGEVLCIGDGETLAFLSDVMVRLEPGPVTVRWITAREADDLGIYAAWIDDFTRKEQ